MNAGLTRGQARCLDVIKLLTVDDVSPSFGEIQTALGVKSKSTVYRLVQGLQERGAVAYRFNQARSIRVIDETGDPATLNAMSSERLRMLIAHAAGILAHRDGGGQTAQILDRIGRRLSGRPLARVS